MRPKRSASRVSLLLAVVIGFTFVAPARANRTEVPDQHSKLSPELHSLLAESNSAVTHETVRVIVQSRDRIESLTNRLSVRGGRVSRALPVIDGYVAEVPVSALGELASDPNTQFVSLDRETILLGRYDYDLLRTTTGTANVSGKTGLPSGRGDGDQAIGRFVNSLPEGVNGSGVTIAILDSGIYDHGPLHEDLRVINNAGSRRVIARENFVSTEIPENSDMQRGFDPFGHGTHVAGIAAGSGRESIQAADEVGNLYTGIAFNANLVDLRVIGSEGTGRISDAIAAIDWMIRNRHRYNIRVANLSIGAAVTQSFITDPFCRAVNRAVMSGITCVVAAGNFGKDSDGTTLYGGILAPANDPSVITVGATNTWGSIERSDDTIASYSSRGPTLIDGLAKPDLVAPGTLIRSVAADGNYLAVNHNLSVYSAEGREVYMWLSGTSMAAPTVAGVAALMLQANSGLTPAMIKSILQFTAQPLESLAETHPLIAMLTQGAGYLNADAAVRLALAFDQEPGRKRPGAQLLTGNQRILDRVLYSSSNPVAGHFTSTIADETIPWGNNVFYSHGLVYSYQNGRLSVRLSSGWQVSGRFNIYHGYLLTDGRLVADGRLMADSRLLTDGRLVVDGRVLTDGRVLSDGWLWDTEGDELTNPSAVAPTYSSSLLDHTYLETESVFGLREATELIRAWGDDAAGIPARTIGSKRHPLYPRAKRIRL